MQKLFFDDRNTNDCRQPNKAEKERNGGGKQVEQERKEGERGRPKRSMRRKQVDRGGIRRKAKRQTGETKQDRRPR